jgi:N-acetylmuramoyl-L-alanine amidase
MTLDDIRALGQVPILTLTLWGEARGEPIESRIGVALVVRNRVRADLGQDGKPDWWGEGYDGVCLARQQFSCWNETDPNVRKLLVLASQPDRWLDDPILSECRWIAEGVVGGRVSDRVGHATHYYAASMRVPPAWATGARLVTRCGNHLFFEDVR